MDINAAAMYLRATSPAQQPNQQPQSLASMASTPRHTNPINTSARRRSQQSQSRSVCLQEHDRTATNEL